MTSPARAHLARLAAAQGAAQAAPGSAHSPAATQEQNLYRVKLDADRRRLKAIQSIAKKIEVKRELLPAYAEYVAGALAADPGHPDQVLGYVLAWSIDAGDYTDALPLADYFLRHSLPLPDRFERTTATLIAEEPAEQALRAIGAGQPFDVDVLRRIHGLTQDHDMPDQVRAKLLLAMGRLLADDEPAQALACLRDAYALNEKVGAKRDIENLERKLRNEQPPASGT